MASIVDYLNPFSENFILKDLFTFLGDIISFINPFSEDFILKDFFEGFSNLSDWLNPSSDNFFVYKLLDLLGDLLKWLLVPSDDYIQGQIDDIKYRISQKIPYEDYIEIFESVENVQGDGDLSVNLNNYNFGNGLTYNNDKFIDFSWITNYKDTWYSWVRGVIFILLVIYNINQVNKLFRGYNVAEGINKVENSK